MAKTANKLQKPFLAKEETERFLANLDKLKSEGTITEEQYNFVKEDYNQRLAAANSEIAQQRVELTSRVGDCQTSLATNKLELERLGLRFKVGELPLERYQRLDRKVRKRISKTEAEIAELERLLKANSSSDIGVPPTKLTKVGAGRERFSIPEASSFTTFISSLEEVKSPRTRLLALAGALFLFISVFMPWASAEAFGFSISVSGLDLSGHLGAAGIICGLLGIAAAFLAESEARGFVHILVGTIPLIVLLIVNLFSSSSLEEFGEYGKLIEGMIKGLVTSREGFVFYIVAAIAVICGGVFERREG